MPTFLYQGRNSEGVSVTGKRLSQSADALSAQLIKEGIIPVNITVAEVEVSGWKQIKNFLFQKKISTDDLAIFCRQMHTLIKSGVPISAGIRQLAESTHNIDMATALFNIVESLEGGQDLAGAMQSFPKVFPPLIVNLVRVGQNSGRLDEIFLSLYEFLEMESSSIKRTKTVLRYPTIVFVTLVVAVIVVNIFVIPAFAKAYAKVNMTLPFLTRFLIGMSDFFNQNWFLILIAFVIICFAFYYYIKTPQGTLALNQLQLKIPGIGSIIKRIIMMRFAQTFAVVVNAGIPVVEGIALVAGTVQNQYIRDRILLMHNEIQRGKTLTQAAAAAGIFSPLELQMLAVSEETGSLGTMLNQIAEMYFREVDYELKRLIDIVEPVVILGLSVFVLGLALAVYLPIWNMIKMVHQ